MLLWPECIPCTLKMALGVARTVMKDEAMVRRFLQEAAAMMPLRAEGWQTPSPELAAAVWRKLVEITGEPDPLRAVKDRQSETALALYPHARALLATSRDPFSDALKLAIAGNALDAMVGVDAEPAAGLIEGLGKLALEPGEVDTFRRRIRGASTIVYFSDNCGEIVFDRLLLETLREAFGRTATVVTRTLPVLNDATVEDAERIGLAEVARVIGNGIQEPFPGTVLRRVSAEVRALVAGADLVVSKGVGNLETLTEEPILKGRITYLYHGKCIPCCSLKGLPLGALVVHNS